MSKIRTILIDDEKGNIITLVEMLRNYCPDVEILATASDINEAEIAIKKYQPQLIFLDIEMPFGNGFDLLNRLQPINFEVVFITAFNNYAIKAFKYAAIDYLLKPVNIEELINSVQKVKTALEQSNLSSRIDHLLTNINNKEVNSKKLGIPTSDSITFIEVDDIMYLESDKNYTKFCLTQKRKEMASKALKEYEELLPKNTFCRVHKSYIINIAFIKKYQRGRGGYVVMEDGTSIEVSSRKKDELMAMILQ